MKLTTAILTTTLPAAAAILIFGTWHALGAPNVWTAVCIGLAMRVLQRQLETAILRRAEDKRLQCQHKQCHEPDELGLLAATCEQARIEVAQWANFYYTPPYCVFTLEHEMALPFEYKRILAAALATAAHEVNNGR